MPEALCKVVPTGIKVAVVPVKTILPEEPTGGFLVIP
jgi:hypothetical protein